MRYLVILVVVLACWGSADLRAATTWPAASCNNTAAQPHVQNAINSAANGDTVTVPAGSCTWTQNLALSGKYFSLIGAGGLG